MLRYNIVSVNEILVGAWCRWLVNSHELGKYAGRIVEEICLQRLEARLCCGVRQWCVYVIDAR